MLAFSLVFATNLAADGGGEGLVAAAAAEAAEAAAPRAGEFCELVGERRLRVSCFALTRGEAVAVEGVAYSRGAAFATWRSDAVLADSGTSLVYRYTADLGGRAVAGVSHLRLPEPGGVGGGWYMGEDGARVPFLVLEREALADCLGTSPAEASSEALRACAERSAE